MSEISFGGISLYAQMVKDQSGIIIGTIYQLLIGDDPSLRAIALGSDYKGMVSTHLQIYPSPLELSNKYIYNETEEDNISENNTEILNFKNSREWIIYLHRDGETSLFEEPDETEYWIKHGSIKTSNSNPSKTRIPSEGGCVWNEEEYLPEDFELKKEYTVLEESSSSTDDDGYKVVQNFINITDLIDQTALKEIILAKGVPLEIRRIVDSNNIQSAIIRIWEELDPWVDCEYSETHLPAVGSFPIYSQNPICTKKKFLDGTSYFLPAKMFIDKYPIPSEVYRAVGYYYHKAQTNRIICATVRAEFPHMMAGFIVDVITQDDTDAYVGTGITKPDTYRWYKVEIPERYDDNEENSEFRKNIIPDLKETITYWVSSFSGEEQAVGDWVIFSKHFIPSRYIHPGTGKVMNIKLHKAFPVTESFWVNVMEKASGTGWSNL